MSTARKNIGNLNRYITIQASTLLPDGQGGNLESWLDAIYTFAEVLPGSSTKTFNNRAIEIQSDIRFRIRTGTNINKNNRIFYNNRICIIEGIRNDDWFEEFQIISCRFSDNATGAATGGGSSEYPPVGGLNSKYLTVVAGNTIVDSDLNGFSILNLYRNGIALQQGVEYSFAGSTVTFTMDLIIGEWIYVIYG